MRTCFVPLCDSKNKNEPNRTMFIVPREKSLLAQWADILPKLRKLKTTDRVCYIHFRANEILTTFDHEINGQIYQLKRDRPRLKPDAVPCLELPSEDELSYYKYKVKSRPTSNNSKVSADIEEPMTQEIFELDPQEYHTNYELNQIYEDAQQEDQIDSNIVTIEECEIQHIESDLQTTKDLENQVVLLFDENVNENYETIPCITTPGPEESIADLYNSIYDNVYELETPNTLWGIHRCPNRSIIYFNYMDIEKMQVTKMISIDSDGVVKLFASMFLIKVLHLINDVDNMVNLSKLLKQVDMWLFCLGQDSNPDCEIIVESSDQDRSWSTGENEQVFFCKICLPENQC